MDKAELLSEFESRVNKFEKYQSFIDKAKSQAGKFAAAVVDKVVADNEEKSMEVVGEIIPLMADMEGVISQLNADKETAQESAKDSTFKLEELELRHMIGDLTDEAFEGEAAEFKAVVESTEIAVSGIDEELVEFRSAIERWQELGGTAGVLGVDSGGAVDDEEIEVDDEGDEEILVDDGEDEEDIIMAADDDDDDADLDVDIEGFDGDEEGGGQSEGSGQSESISLAEDLSVVFEEDDDDDDAGDGFEVGDLDILGDDEEIELEAGEAPEDDDEDDDKPRRAVLLYQEGTAEEQIYPFTGEVMSLGRGRDNDVQVKNDSKVSRYHCKLYRRGPNFYIEDNKSANGTLVNGELITERRLFGGEEVIIGETFFRFRILD